MLSRRPVRELLPAFASCLALASLILAGTAPADGAVTSCTRYASTSGSDSAAGTSAAPFASVQKLVDSLSAGQTGCLTGGGTFAGNVTFSSGGSSGAPVTLTSDPASGRATIKGVVYVPPTAPYVTIDDVKVDATNAGQGVAVQLFADYAKLTNSELYGADQERIGVQVGYQKTVTGVEIAGNRIHDFGVSGIYDHGIYVDLANGVQVHDNTIYDNAGGYGIQLWTHSMNGHIYDNTIDGNGAGSIIIAGQQNANGGPSSNNEIDHNILSNPGSGHNVVIFWSNYPSDSPGTGNTVHDNVYWNGDLDTGAAYCSGSCSGVSYSNNTKTDPQYANRSAKDFTTQLAYGASPAPAGSTDATAAPSGSTGTTSGSTSTPSPAPTTTAPVANTTAPAVSGNALVGETLTATAGAWSGDPASYAYAWQRCDASGKGCAAISGATGASYVLAAADAGSTIRAAVTATSATSSATASSAPTQAVIAAVSSIAAGAVLSGTVGWTATVPAGARSVEFWVDGVRLQTLTSGPFAYQLDTTAYANGPHIVGVAWTDSAGTRHPASPATNVTVDNSVVSSLTEGMTIGGTVHWTATAPSGTASVEFWIDGTRLQTLTAGPYAYDLDTTGYANGPHSVGVAWTDGAGVRHPASPAVDVTIDNAPTATSSLTGGMTLRGNVRWTATAPAGTKSVEFWMDNKRLAKDSGAPYAYNLNTAKYRNGAHVVDIAWTDSHGVRHVTTPVTVTFAN